MAKRFKKVVALLLALALCAGQITVPAYAAENTESEGNTAEEVILTVQADGTVIPPEEESEPETVTTVTETVVTDEKTGAVVITEKTETVTADPEADTQLSAVSTETTTISADGTDVHQQNQWESQKVQEETRTEQESSSTVTTETETTVAVEGSEEARQTDTYDPETGIETVSQTGSGEEKTEEVVDTVVTTITEDVLISEEDTTQTENAETKTESKPTTGEWEEGEVNEGSWQEGKVQEGTLGKAETVENKTTELEASNPGEATLDLTPNGKEVKVDVDITAEQVLAGVKIPEGAQEVRRDGKVVGYKVTKTTVDSKPDANPEVGETKTEYAEEKHTPVAPEGYTEGTVEEETENGKIITVTEAIVDDQQRIIGYKVTKTTVTETTRENTGESSADSQSETTQAEETLTLPVRPEESTTRDDSGITVTVTVEDIVENGVTVGYKTLRTFTNDKNEVMRTETDSIYGTASSGSTTVEKDPETEVETVKTTVTTTEVQEIYATDVTREATLTTQRTNEIITTVTTEEDTWQLEKSADGRYYFRYKGVMYPVVELTGHGEVELSGLKPTAKPSAANDLANHTSITNPPSVTNTASPTGSQFKYVDYGLISDFRVTKEDGGNTSEVHLYKLVDADGNAFYAYCADLDTTAYRNTMYNISNAKDENYYQNNQDKDAYEHLQAIAANGYWGTSSGIGSMDAIRKLLRENGKGSVADTITDGEAMTATQAAIWYFGNKSDSKLVDGDNPAKNVSDKTSRNNINALFDILVGEKLKKNTTGTETEIIDREDIVGATLELNGKAVDEKTKEVKKDKKGNEKYNTDLSFTLAVEKSSITGNLKVIVKDESGKTIRQEWLATDDSNFVGKLLAGTSTDKGTTYTIEGLELTEGVKIDLVLDGYQNLEEGVYIYTTAPNSQKQSQTFIGLAEGKRNVNLSVGLKFDVEDPGVEHIEKTRKQTRTDIRVDTKTDTRTDTRRDTTLNTTTDTQTVTETNLKVYGTVTETRTQQEITRSERDWEYAYSYELVRVNDEDGGKGREEEKKDETDDRGGEGDEGRTENGNEVIIPDEQVPLAKAPGTGDISLLWAALSLCSLAALLMLGRKRKEA